MSTAEEVINASPAASESVSHQFWGKIDYFLTRMGDYLNPILVKETRQALKSRQFTASFWLVLLFAAGWSFVGISILMPSVYYLPSGRFMLIGYFVVLCIPLLLVVPFSAFRSLATECEDGTYELLSITSLSARQIVTGKLGSAVLQMMVYYAALAPCIAFTYLLRGMDIGTIVILLVGTFLISVLFCCVGLVFAGMNKSRQWQALSSVLLLIMLIIGGWAWGISMVQLVDQGSTALNTFEFWQGVGFTLSMYFTLVALLILIAAAQNSFASDNRSTKIRITMLVQMILFAGWMIYLWLNTGEGAFAPISLTIGGIVWMIYGAFLTGEFAELSPRARRDLPQSFFGRMFLTWFNPGSATGYIFIVASFMAFVVLIQLVNIIGAANRPGMEYDVNDLFPFGLLLWAYMAFYLGLGRLIIIGLRRVSDFGVTAVFLIHVLVLTASTAFPTFLQYWLQDFRAADYSYLQMMNWMWSLIETMTGSYLMWPVVVTMSLAALTMFCLNLVLAAREVEATRLAAPERVRKDEEEENAIGSPTPA